MGWSETRLKRVVASCREDSQKGGCADRGVLRSSVTLRSGSYHNYLWYLENERAAWLNREYPRFASALIMCPSSHRCRGDAWFLLPGLLCGRCPAVGAADPVDAAESGASSATGPRMGARSATPGCSRSSGKCGSGAGMSRGRLKRNRRSTQTAPAPTRRDESKPADAEGGNKPRVFSHHHHIRVHPRFHFKCGRPRPARCPLDTAARPGYKIAWHYAFTNVYEKRFAMRQRHPGWTAYLGLMAGVVATFVGSSHGQPNDWLRDGRDRPAATALERAAERNADRHARAVRRGLQRRGGSPTSRRRRR